MKGAQPRQAHGIWQPSFCVAEDDRRGRVNALDLLQHVLRRPILKRKPHQYGIDARTLQALDRLPQAYRLGVNAFHSASPYRTRAGRSAARHAKKGHHVATKPSDVQARSFSVCFALGPPALQYYFAARVDRTAGRIAPAIWANGSTC